MDEPQSPYRVLVVDDHGVVRRGLVSLLSEYPDLYVVGEAANGEAAIRLAERHAPDVVIMDIRMPGIGGIEACRRILDLLPQTGVVFLTSFPEEDALVEGMLAGARGYVLKNLSDSNLVEAVRAVARGESILDPSLGASIVQALRRLAGGSWPAGRVAKTSEVAQPVGPPTKGSPNSFGLTDLELTLLRLIAAGRTNQEIADELHFAEKTIRNYVSLLLSKLQLHNRAEAAVFAVRNDLLP